MKNNEFRLFRFIHFSFITKNKNNMLEYVKLILQKVSFDPRLFEKELRKSIANYLAPDEVQSLKKWCYENFCTREFSSVFDECFSLTPM